MRKILLIVVLCLMFLVTGCGDTNNTVSINPGSIFTLDNTHITLDEGYNFCDFTKIYKDDECVVTLRFKNKSKK